MKLLQHLKQFEGQFLSNSIVIYAFRLMGAVLAFFLQVLLARFMGPAEYGIFATVWVVIILLGDILNLGFVSAIQKLIPDYMHSDKTELFRGAIWGNGFVILGVSTIFAMIYLIFVQNFTSGNYAQYKTPLTIAAFALPAYGLSSFIDGISRANNQMTRAFFPATILRPAFIMFFATIAYYLSYKVDASLVIFCALLAIWLAFLFALYLVIWPIRNQLSGPRQYNLKNWLLLALPMVIVSSFELMLYNVDVLALSLLKSPDEVGIYYAATKILVIIYFFNFAVASAVTREIAIGHIEEDKKQLKSLMLSSVYWGFAPIILAMGLLILISPYILRLFGPEFVAAYSIVIILGIGVFIRAMVGPAERVLIMIGEQKLCAIIFGFVVLVDIMLNWLLIPRYGMNGAAYATVIAMVLLSICLHIAVKRKTGISMNIISALRSSERFYPIGGKFRG